MSMTEAQFNDWRTRMDTAIDTFKAATADKAALHKTADATTAKGFAADSTAADAVVAAAGIAIDVLNSEYALSMAVQDVKSPYIVGTNPANAETGVSRTTQILIQFSEKMDPATITSTNIKIKQGANTVAQAGEPALSSGDTLVTVTLASQMAAATVYKIFVDGNVTDIYTNPLQDGDFTQYDGFTTEA